MILFVGDKPSPKMKPGAKPFEGAACEQRLMKWIDEITLISMFARYKYDIINQNDVQWADYQTWILVTPHLRYVTLGNIASKALKGIPHFKLPHPSGRNRQINDKEFIAKKLTECKEWLNETL